MCHISYESFKYIIMVSVCTHYYTLYGTTQHRESGPGVKVFVFGRNGMPYCARRDFYTQGFSTVRPSRSSRDRAGRKKKKKEKITKKKKVVKRIGWVPAVLKTHTWHVTYLLLYTPAVSPRTARVRTETPYPENLVIK